jgi:hypothetical protein
MPAWFAPPTAREKTRDPSMLLQTIPFPPWSAPGDRAVNARTYAHTRQAKCDCANGFRDLQNPACRDVVASAGGRADGLEGFTDSAVVLGVEVETHGEVPAPRYLPK